MSSSYKFPDNFIWGTAVSAHQTEGWNKNTDWWEWEHRQDKRNNFPLEPSGSACDSYNRFNEDFELCKSLNNNAIRISVEWARIEPEEGKFDAKGIEHYKRVLEAAKSKGLMTFVTLHHFTNPLWFSKKGGWEHPNSVNLFAKYSRKCAEEFKDDVDVFLTINEPQVYALMSHTLGIWPPSRKGFWKSLVVQLNMMRAHVKAYKEIKNICSIPVGIVKNIIWYETDPYNSKFFDVFATKFLYFLNEVFYLCPILKRLDLIGLNYYFTARITNLRINSPSDYVSDLGWWINPVGLEKVLLKLKKYKRPVYVTENGLADSEDKYRKKFIRDMLISCARALDKGVKLKGYFHWSLLDNYEWHQGYWPKFGLVEINRNNDLERRPRESFYYYADICKNNLVKEQNNAEDN